MNKKKVIYPCYFNAELTRAEGRRVNKTDAVANPSLKAISLALKKLGLAPESEEKKSHPSYWVKAEGRILVEYSGKKEELLKKIALKLKE